MAIASGEYTQGRFGMEFMPIMDLPRNEALLILWSYRQLKDWTSGDQYVLSGITLLNAPSLATAPATINLETISATSVPTQQLKQALRDAPETLVLDNTVIRLMVFPWENRMPMAVSRDANTGLTTSDSMHIGFRLISEHGKTLPMTLRVQAIWMVQDDQIWNVGEIEETVGASRGSSRDFLVHDVPHWRSMAPVDVVLTLRDDKDAVHWLAARDQRITAVE
jgi:hypothetical protein